MCQIEEYKWNPNNAKKKKFHFFCIYFSIFQCWKSNGHDAQCPVKAIFVRDARALYSHGEHNHPVDENIKNADFPTGEGGKMLNSLHLFFFFYFGKLWALEYNAFNLFTWSSFSRPFCGYTDSLSGSKFCRSAKMILIWSVLIQDMKSRSFLNIQDQIQIRIKSYLDHILNIDTIFGQNNQIS